jgi:hypothetical protein
MESKVVIIGIHPIDAAEPCHLIEIAVIDPDGRFDWIDVTQEVSGLPRDSWQAAYDEQLLDKIDGQSRYAFFFHYLDVSKPLRTSFGEIALPESTPVPPHLEEVKYCPSD